MNVRSVVNRLQSSFDLNTCVRTHTERSRMTVKNMVMSVVTDLT
jgi:hypothetical protein